MSFTVQPVSYSSFCAFCLRAKLPNVDFYKQVTGCSPEQRQCIQVILGYDFLLKDFAACRPCWMLMELLQDFRLRCLKANSLVGRICEGNLRGSFEDYGWFCIDIMENIESFQVEIKHQLKQIERLESAAKESNRNSDGDVEPTEVFDEIKLEPVEINDEAYEPSMEYETTYSNNSAMELECGETISPSKDELSIDSEEGYFKTTMDEKKQHLVTFDDTFNLLTCKVCEAMFKDHKQLKTHQKLHAKFHAKSSYQCRKLCLKSFKTVFNRWKHEQSCETYTQTCKLCDKKLVNKQSLNEHYKFAHPEELKHECTTCGEKFLKGPQLRLHERRFHFEGATEVPCPECGMLFFEARDLMAHFKTQHHNRETFATVKTGGERIQDKSTQRAGAHEEPALEAALQPQNRNHEQKANDLIVHINTPHHIEQVPLHTPQAQVEPVLGTAVHALGRNNELNANCRKEKKSKDSGDRQSSLKGFKLKSFQIINP